MSHLKIKQLVLALIICFCLSPGLAFSAQDIERISAQVSAILIKFPAENSQERNALAAELLSLGPAAVQDLCRRLAAPGTDDDSLVRYALDAAAVYAGRPGAAGERLACAKEILKALEGPRDAEIKAFLIDELRLAGQGEVVRPLAKFLADPALCAPAVRTLAAVKTAEAERVLLKALETSSKAIAPVLVRGLGEMKSAGAVKKLLPLATSPDPTLRQAALSALAAIGDPAAASVLEKTAVTASPYERAQAASLYLLYAERLLESGRKDAAERIGRDFVRNYGLAGESQVRAAALALLGRIKGPGVIDDLVEAAESRDKAYRTAALGLAEKIPGEMGTARWIERLAQADPEVRADIIVMLGRRGDPSALPSVRAEIKSETRSVRIAAIAASARLGGETVFEDVWPCLQTEDEEQIAAVKQALATFPSDKLVPRAAALFGDAGPKARAALIEVLADRRATSQAGLVLALAGSQNEIVRKSALAALESLVRAEDVPQLLDLVLAASAAREITQLQNALAAAANRNPDPELRALLILDAAGNAPAARKPDLIRPLAKIGGARALQFVVAALQDPEASTQAAALYALSNWRDSGALDELFKIARAASDRKTRYLALQGIGRLAAGSSLSADQKFTTLRSALDLAVEPDEKKLLVGSLAAVKSGEALNLIAPYLDDPASRTWAAPAVLRAVLPAPGFPGMAGYETALILKKALISMDDEYDQAQAEDYARKLLFQAGFTSLFNGKSLAGWKGLVADPPARVKMTPVEMKKAQAEADAFMRGHWKVIDGALVFDGKGHSLCTLKDYGDFEMFVDWKIEPKGDSGIYLRGSPQIQIWDLTQSADGSGGLYNNKIHPSKPLVRADRPVGEWNAFHIKMTGERVTVRLNGLLVADDVVMENYWERDKPIYPVGQIEIQAHSTPLHFRNIYIREIPEESLTPTGSPAAEEGFTALFNGRDLAGWTGDTKGYQAEDGAIVVSPAASGNLYTENEFGDFVFRFEFKLTPGANNGIGIRTPLEGDAAYAGMEIQVLDDSADVYKKLKPYQYHGSIYGVVPVKRGFQKLVGEWNSEEIIAVGRRITVILNGTTVVDADLDQASAPQTIDGRDHPGLKRDRGHIGFLGHGTRVEFRNIRIKELKRPS